MVSKYPNLLDQKNNLTSRAAVEPTEFSRIAFFSWKYFQGSLVFPRTPCQCDPSQVKNTHEHVLFHCSVGDSVWTLAHNLISIFEENQTSKTRISSEIDIWTSINNTSTLPQTKITILCALMARWLNRWKPPHTSSSILWKDFLNNAVSAELDKALQLPDEECRKAKIRKTKSKWLEPRLFKLKFTNLFLRYSFH